MATSAWTWAISCLLVLGRVVATDRPIVGVLVQEVPVEVLRAIPKGLEFSRSYIPASYVKAVEAAGARAVPIFINKTLQYYRNLLTKVNGVVLPGGSTNFTVPGGYAEAGGKIYKTAQELQDSGVHFPILGVCQGFELLMFLAANCSEDVLVNCNCSNTALPLDFRPGFESSHLYSQASQDIIDILKMLPVTSNHHRFCVIEEKLKEFDLEKSWRVLSTNLDLEGLEFISSIEHVQRPLAGVQFHPEKNMYEWSPQQLNPHSRKAVLSARIFYDWLVNESRLNNQSFSSPEEEDSFLMYNYSPVYTGRAGGYNEQVYLFPSDTS